VSPVPSGSSPLTETDVRTFPAARGRQLAAAGFGVVVLVIGIALLPRVGGWVAIVLGIVALLAGLSVLLPDAAYVRLSPDGLTVKYSFLPHATVPWREIAEVESRLVPIVRHRVPSLVVTYVDGYLGERLGQNLDEHRSYVGNFTKLPGDDLARAAEEYRTQYGGLPPAGEPAGGLAAVE
jgi:hypothetical protein